MMQTTIRESTDGVEVSSNENSEFSATTNGGRKYTSPLERESPVDRLGQSFAGDINIEDEDDGPHHGGKRRGSLKKVDFAEMRPAVQRAGERTVSTSLRLRRQGFTAAKSGQSDFAVKSIRRGSDEWSGLLQPFVSDLAFRSLEYRRYQSEVSFRPYTCQAAVLFVDLSSYSKITAAIAHRGAHAMSTVVNAYFSRLLTIVNSNGGDVVKFAGDALLVVWEGEKTDLEINVVTAAKCAMEMQEKAGCHVIEGTPLCFRIHCGLCVGALESEVFAAQNHVNMQRLYHSVGGDSLTEISELVDIAKAGEVCLSQSCIEYLGDRGTYREVEDADDCKILTRLDLDEPVMNKVESHLEHVLSDRLLRRNKRIEEDFIHPAVIKLLSHGGLSPTQIAQMRNLCVLFIAMTSKGSSVNWLMEVQEILDKNRCPIVQIIDDDKGVHVVAAVSLYESISETCYAGVEVCFELVGQQVGCAVGMAQGSTFCGVTGCASVACRWDITGPPAVRAARLMQYALRANVEVAIDQSVYDDPMAATRMSLANDGVELKGCKGTVPIYTISHASLSSAFRVLETVHGRIHDGIVKVIEDHIGGANSRCAVVVTGIPLAGKKIVCQRAAGFADLVPYLHVSDVRAGFLQLARTIATWFQYVDDDDVRDLAESVLEHVGKRRWSRAHDECINLVNLALEDGLRACFLVDRVQFLDDFSLSLVREILHGRMSRRSRSFNSHLSDTTSLHGNCSEHSDGMGDAGKIVFLCVHVSLYNWKSASHIVADIKRSNKTLSIPTFSVGEATRDELMQLAMDLSDIKIEERWLDAFADASGNTAGYFVERSAATVLRLESKEKLRYIDTTEELALFIPPGIVRAVKQIPVGQISAEVAMRFSGVFDGLPPLFQTFRKVLAVASRTGFYKLPQPVMWAALNDLIADGVEAGVFKIVIDEMVEMGLVKAKSEGGEDVISFQSPALGDVAFEVSTPVQVESIGNVLIERLEPLLLNDFKVPFVVANLHDLVGDEEGLKEELWVQGYKTFLQESANWETGDINKWKELIHDEIQALGSSSLSVVMGDSFALCSICKPTLCDQLKMVKMYHGPVAFGPMGHTLSVICRTVFHEYGGFHGYGDERVMQVRDSITSACSRYSIEIRVVEGFLAEQGCPGDSEALRKEFDVINGIAAPSTSDMAVQRKAAMLLEEYIPRFVENRLRRLYDLVEKLREGDIPDVVQRSEDATRLAYVALRSPKYRSDAAQDALMILAARNWKPKPVPEFLPMIFYQTVARIRNKVLKRLSDPELALFKHRQDHLDLEAFLIVTPLLYEAQRKGKC